MAARASFFSTGSTSSTARRTAGTVTTTAFGAGGSGTRVGLGGLEPPASSLSGMRSNQLSYRPVNLEQLTWPGWRLRRGGPDDTVAPGRHRGQAPSPVALSRCLASARTPPGPLGATFGASRTGSEEVL